MILVTGGTGYIGSHAVVALIEAGYKVVILDNLSNSSEAVLDRIARITGKRPVFVRGDVRDASCLKALFDKHPIRAVMHFAGSKAVGESVAKPLEYYDNNVHGSLVLLGAMQTHGIQTIVFSSSATVYDPSTASPWHEEHPVGPVNPYGQTKLAVEHILRDLNRADHDTRIAILRYFNPVGAHESGLIGEAPQGIPNNLMPYIAQVAVKARDAVTVFGNDYPTPDGTGVRDYIHVMDLVEGHVAALKYLANNNGLITLNLGTGTGISVLEMITAYEKASSQKINYNIGPRRSGDAPAYWANSTQAEKILGWKTRRTLDQMCADSWKWQQFQSTQAEQK